MTSSQDITAALAECEQRIAELDEERAKQRAQGWPLLITAVILAILTMALYIKDADRISWWNLCQKLAATGLVVFLIITLLWVAIYRHLIGHINEVREVREALLLSPPLPAVVVVAMVRKKRLWHQFFLWGGISIGVCGVIFYCSWSLDRLNEGALRSAVFYLFIGSLIFALIPSMRFVSLGLQLIWGVRSAGGYKQ